MDHSLFEHLSYMFMLKALLFGGNAHARLMPKLGVGPLEDRSEKGETEV